MGNSQPELESADTKSLGEGGGGIGSGERVSCRREEREEHIDFILLEKIRKNKGHRMKTRKIRKLRNTI